MWHKRSKVQVNQKTYTIVRVYEKKQKEQIYIVSDEKKLFMMKRYDDLDHYKKILQDYTFLESINVCIPKIIRTDDELKVIVKEYVTGTLASSKILKGEQPSYYLTQMKEMASIVEENQQCLDYFPTNYIEFKNKLYYVHYECFPFSKEKSFENVVNKYWINSSELIRKMNGK